jgi:3-dehydroquinate dehydratase-2
MLDKRDKSVYGDSSLEKIEQNCKTLSGEIGLKVEFEQSNIEGEIVNFIQDAFDKFDGIIINAAAYTHTSVAIRDALDIYKKPKVEIHLSNIFNREEFRKTSMISDVVDAIVSGFGDYGYEVALRGIDNIIKNRK